MCRKGNGTSTNATAKNANAGNKSASIREGETQQQWQRRRNTNVTQAGERTEGGMHKAMGKEEQPENVTQSHNTTHTNTTTNRESTRIQYEWHGAYGRQERERVGGQQQTKMKKKEEPPATPKYTEKKVRGSWE